MYRDKQAELGRDKLTTLLRPCESAWLAEDEHQAKLIRDQRRKTKVILLPEEGLLH